MAELHFRKDSMAKQIFPSWTNYLKEILGVLSVGGAVYVTVLVWIGFSPKAISVGYMPEQPIEYSHALHAGELGIDCQYCHNTVTETSHAAVPPTSTCMGCHDKIHTESEKLTLLRDSHAEGLPVPWAKIHDLPDYAYFNHSRHVNSGVSCVSCHGRVDTMEVVWQTEELSMGWCLDCHRDPAPHIRPLDKVTDLDWVPDEDPRVLGERLIEEYGIQTSTDCSTCHR